MGWQPTRCSFGDSGRQGGGSVQGHTLRSRVERVQQLPWALSLQHWLCPVRSGACSGPAHRHEAPPSQPMPSQREPLLLKIQESLPAAGHFSSPGAGSGCSNCGSGFGSSFGSASGSGSHSRNSCNSVLTVSGHSSITMWLPSSMSLRKASSRICGHTEKSLLLSTLQPHPGGCQGWPVTLLDPLQVFYSSLSQPIKCLYNTPRGWTSQPWLC